MLSSIAITSSAEGEGILDVSPPSNQPKVPGFLITLIEIKYAGFPAQATQKIV
jgi:hypothetical protein